MDGANLLEKLRRIEALFAGTTTEGEKLAAAEARRRIQGRLELSTRQQRQGDVETGMELQ